ncbi:MAG: nuclear transport factor 2 family protein [Actinomycetota bacterium]|nr:nuclear transport factor 2 family protein [Actinomycetota bacterium]
MSHTDLIERLYEGLRTLDGDTMADCYTSEARFEDPAFGELTGERIGGMWRMLTSGSDGIEVDLSDVIIKGDEGSAHWVARYKFGATGRSVVNRATARYRFDGELIDEHIDTFSFHSWSRQALGPAGLLFGWTPILRNKVRSQALSNLDRFLARASEADDA